MMSWLDGEHYSCPVQSLGDSFLLSLESALLFCQNRGIMSHQNSSTHRLPQFPPRNLRSLVTFAVFSLIFAASNTTYFSALFSLRLAESKILFAVPKGTHPRTRTLISFCTVQLQIVCATHSLGTLCLSTTSGPGPGELPSFWGSMVFRHALIPRKGSGNNNNNLNQKESEVVLNVLSKIYCPNWCFN